LTAIVIIITAKSFEKLVGEVPGATEEIAHIVQQFLTGIVAIIASIPYQFVGFVLPIHDVNAGIGIVAGGEHDCDGGEIVLVLVKVSGRITAVVVKALVVGRNIAPFKILIPDKDTSAVIGEIRCAHNAKSFMVTL
jgi:hypothetical protein